MNNYRGILYDPPHKILDYKSKDYLHNIFSNQNKTLFGISKLDHDRFLPSTTIKSKDINLTYRWNDTTAIEYFTPDDKLFRLNNFGKGSHFDFEISKTDFITSAKFIKNLGILITFYNSVIIYNNDNYKKFDNIINNKLK
jgi:hypothetical protein